MRRACLLVIIISSLFIFGCGGGGGSSNSETDTETELESSLTLRQTILAELLNVEEYIFEDWFNLINTESIAFDARLQVGSVVSFDDGSFSDTNDKGQWLRLRDCEEGTVQVGEYVKYDSVSDVKSASVNFHDFYGVSLKSQTLPLTECPEGYFRIGYWDGSLALSFKDHGYLLSDFTGAFGNYPNIVSPEPFISYFSAHNVSGYSGVLAVHGKIDIVETEEQKNISSPYLNHYIAARSGPSLKYEKSTFTKDEERQFTRFDMTRENKRFYGIYSRRYKSLSFNGEDGFSLRDYTLQFDDINFSEVDFNKTLAKGVVNFHITLHGIDGEPNKEGIGHINYTGEEKEIFLNIDGVSQTVFEDSVDF